jgi:zinc protease
MPAFEYERRLLGNRVVLLYHRTRRIPMVAMATLMRFGKDQNPLGLPGLSAVTARLLDEGTDSRTQEQIADCVESVGGQLSTFSDREFSGVELEVQSRHLGLGVELMADLVRHPAFLPKRLELERLKMLTQLRSMQDDPNLQGSLLLNREIFRGTPLAEPTLGTLESLPRITREHVVEFHRRCYGPQTTAVVAVGDVDAEQFFELADEAFSDWENPHVRMELVEVPPPPVKSVKHRLVADREQIHLFLGGPGIARRDPDFHTAQVMDALFGGGPGLTSRIPRKIRDELGLAYSVYADLSGSAGRYPGRFVAYAGTSPELETAALDAMRAEVTEFLEHGPTASEVETAQKFLTGSFVFELQSNTSVLRYLLGAETYGLPIDYIERYPERIATITPEEVLRVARLHLDPIHFVTVLVGPPVKVS